MSVSTSRVTVATNTYTSSVFREPVKFNFMQVAYTSDANAGNRQIKAAMYDSSNNLIWDSHAGAVQAASNVYHYEWMPGIYRETAFVDNSIQVPFPADMVLPANYYFKVFDDTGVSASDTMVITFQYRSAVQD